MASSPHTTSTNPPTTPTSPSPHARTLTLPPAFFGAAVLLVCAGCVVLGGATLETSVLVTKLSIAVVVRVAVPTTMTPPEVVMGEARAVERVEAAERAEEGGTTRAVEKVERTLAAEAEALALARIVAVAAVVVVGGTE